MPWFSRKRPDPDAQMALNDHGNERNSTGKGFGWFGKVAKTTVRKSSALIDRAAPHLTAVSRFGISKIASFWNDPFHTLLNLEWFSFIFVFFSTYLLLYLAFAWVYWLQGNCVIDSFSFNFSHAIFLSSRVASTLGFDDVRPDPDCSFINFCVMIQVIASSLINFIMLGVVFARFSAPFKRASTVRFSKVAVIHRHPSGFWALTLRVANLRKQQILQPAVRMVATAVDSITPSFYHHEQLAIEGLYKQLTNMELGFPAHITHVITPDSYLYNFSLLEMDTRMMEILVFVDGIDAMTSRHMSARIAFSTSDIYMNEMFAPMNLEQRGRSVGLDFSTFDKTVPAIDPSLLLDEKDMAAHRGNSEGGLWQLRHQTFKKLAEKYSHLGASASTYGTGAPSDIVSNGPQTPLAAGGAAASDSNHQTATQSLLPADATPSHTGSAVAAPVKGMSLSTTGMPFPIARPATQPESGLAGIFGVGGSKAAATGTGGAWVQPHSSAHQDAPGSASGSGGGGATGSPTRGAGESFVALTAFQRGATGSTGTAWQQSSPNIIPGTSASAGATPTQKEGAPAAGAVFTDGNKKSPLMQTGIYSLDDTEHQAGEADATLPQSHKAT